MKINWNFLGGGGCKTKNLPRGEYGYFLELHNLLNHRRERTGSHFVKFTYIITFYSLKQSLNFWRKKNRNKKQCGNKLFTNTSFIYSNLIYY